MDSLVEQQTVRRLGTVGVNLLLPAGYTIITDMMGFGADVHAAPSHRP